MTSSDNCRVTVLIVTAAAAEAEAVRKGLSPDSPISVTAVGVGMAAAAASTAKLLTLSNGGYRAVINAGIGGGIGLPLGSIALASRSIAADLGADSPDGFISLDDLGFGSTALTVDQKLLTAMRSALPDAVVGDVLTVSTITGTSARIEGLIERYPAAVAEGMEGYAVGVAAELAGVAFAELRTISNLVGPRDRGSWQIGAALAGLTEAAALLEKQF
jgi:futalosine hydrolase